MNISHSSFFMYFFLFYNLIRLEIWCRTRTKNRRNFVLVIVFIVIFLKIGCEYMNDLPHSNGCGRWKKETITTTIKEWMRSKKISEEKKCQMKYIIFFLFSCRSFFSIAIFVVIFGVASGYSVSWRVVYAFSNIRIFNVHWIDYLFYPQTF